MQKERLLYLLNKYKTKSCSANELQELEQWYEYLDEHKQAIEGNAANELSEQMLQTFRKMLEERELIKSPVVSFKNRRWLRVTAAAVIIGFLGIGAYLYIAHISKSTIAKAQTVLPKVDVAPGSNKAILTLANGSNIALDEVQKGSIAYEGETNIIKMDSGVLAYSGGKGANVQYNTLSTPRGGQYQLTLEDGTKVWLNAASSLKYPTVFKGDERNVELTGEAYFEVVHNAAMPFHVKVNDMVVEVLGTHFNVMAYGDEDAVKTTLLEGSVRVMNGQSSMVKLIPGQQAQLNKSGDLKLVKDADVDEAVAWKENRFQFNSTNITEVMKEISRWYDVDVEYKTDVNDVDFSGIISRKENASKVLSILEATGTIHFEIEGNKILVSRK